MVWFIGQKRLVNLISICQYGCMSTAATGPDPSTDRREWFATTHWSVVLAAGNSDSLQAAESLEKLCKIYWYPLYAFVRRKGYGVPEAEDLTQEFFARLLRRNFPAGIKPEGGKFRSYLLSALQHFLANDWHSVRAKKRGGGQTVLSIQALEAENRYQLEPASDSTPEFLYDRQWASVLLEQVGQRLRDEYTGSGKGERFERLCPYLTGKEPTMSYAELARQLGGSETAAKMAVHRLRRRYGELLRQEIAQTVARPEDVDEEIRALISVV